MKLFPIILSASVLLAAPAAAQQAPPRVERPYRGLFGGGVGNTEQLLTLQVSLGGGYDDNVLAGSSGTGSGLLTGPQTGQGSTFTGISTDLAYNLTRKRVGINASIVTSSRYHPGLASTKFISSQSGSAGAFLQVARNTRLEARHTTTHQPYLTLGLFPALFDVPGDAMAPPQELGVERSDYLSHNSSIALSQGLGRRTSLGVNYGYRRDDFEGAGRDLSGPSAGARLTVQLQKGLGVYGGYRYTGARYGANAANADEERPYTQKGIDAGIDFNRALSFSRRTTFSFATGSTALAESERTVYRVTGRAALNHEIGRSSNAVLAYSRDVNFIETFAEPVFADAVTLGFVGLLTRRLQFHSTLAASFGTFAFTTEGGGFATYTGSTGVTYALTRHLGLGVDYSYYRYSFDATALLPPGFSREMDRQSVQANLSLWVPLMHRARRPDAAR